MVDERAQTSKYLPQVSLRARLTIWAIAISALIQIVLASVFILYRRSSLFRYFDQQLVQRTQLVVERFGNVPPVQAGDLGLRMASDDLFDDIVFVGSAVVIADASGTVVSSSVDPAPVVPPNLLRLTAQNELVALRTVPLSLLPTAIDSARSAHAAALGFTADDGQRFTLIVIAPDVYVQQVITQLIRSASIMIPVGIAAAGVGAWLIAGLAVAPIKNLESVLKSLGPDSITHHMELDSDDREVARLGGELEAARARIERGFRAQERFISNVSHELKTPISVLLAESETLGQSPTVEDYAAFVHSARDEMRRLGSMIESFLTLTRVTDGTRSIKADRYLVNELILDSVEHCLHMSKQYEVDLQPHLLESEADVDAEITGDPHLLRTMLDNLVRNAIRFSPEGSKIVIDAATTDGRATVSVRDYGPGIPESIIARVFDRFSQADAESRRGRGHGLGLEIAQGIAELHGGEIKAENCPDNGCRFTIYLPIGNSHHFKDEPSTRPTLTA